MGTNVAWSGVERRVTAVRHAEEDVEAGSMAQAIAGGAAVVLSILALIGVLPDALSSIAAIVLGGALLISAAAIVARFGRATGAAQPAWAHHEVLGGLGMEAMAALAAIVLGIVALSGANTVTLLNCTAIVLGAGLILASGSMLRLEEMARRGPQPSEGVGAPAMYMSSGTEALVGGGVAVLGIIALAGHAPLVLAAIAFLSLGAVAIMSGSAVVTRMVGMLG